MPMLQFSPLANYQQSLLRFLKAVEGPHYNPKNVGDGVITIGLGFNLNGKEEERKIVVAYLAEDLSITATAAQRQINDDYRRQLNSAITDTSKTVGQRITTLHTIMGNRAADAALAKVLVSPRTRFEFSSNPTTLNTEVDQVFGQISKYYDDYADPTTHRVLGDLRHVFPALWDNATNSWVNGFADSREHAVLFSFVYNGGQGLVGKNLRAAITSGDRARAWYEIRYGSSKEAWHVIDGIATAEETAVAPGLAKRRYLESEMFGLYAAATATETEAKDAYRVLTAFRESIIKYEKRWGSSPDNLAGTASRNMIAEGKAAYSSVSDLAVPRTLIESLAPAYVSLVAWANNQRATGAPVITAVLISNAAAIYYGGDSGVFLDATADDTRSGNGLNNNLMIGGAGNDGMLGGGGNDYLMGLGGNDALEGGAGNDTLVGGAGNDLLSGGADDDIYVLTKTGGGVDTVRDKDGTNKILLDGNSLSVDASTKASEENTYKKDDITYVLEGKPDIDGRFNLHIKNGENDIAIVENFKNGDFGLTFGNQIAMDKTGEATPFKHGSTVTTKTIDLSEGLAAGFNVFFAAGAASGQKVKIILNGADPKLFSLVLGDDVKSFEGGEIMVDLNTGMTQRALTLLSKGDAAADATLTLTATLVDAGGNPVPGSEPATMTVNFDAMEAVDDGLNTTRDIKGDLKPTDFDHDQEGVQAHTDELGNVFVDSTPDPDRKDALNGSADNDHITSGGGNDTITATQGGDDKIDAGAGDDDVTLGSGKAQVQGGAGSDYITTVAGKTIIEGGEGADILLGGTDDDSLFGGDKGTLDEIFLRNDSQEGSGEKGDFIAGADGKDQLAGDTGNDWIIGGDGKDLLFGGGGDDFLMGDARVSGGPTRDWTVTLSTSKVGQTTYFSYEPAEVSVADVTWGDDDALYGGAGNDWLYGGAGDDLLDGGSGDDVLAGGYGADVLLGGTGNDTLSGEWIGTSKEDSGNDYLDGGDGDDWLIGGWGGDTLFGGSGGDSLYGDLQGETSGDDYLDGEDGNDSLWGGAGNDTLYGGADDDSISGDKGGEDDNSTGDDYLDGEDGNDSLWGDAGNDTLYGGDGNDQLAGDRGGSGDTVVGNDYLDGEDGDDTLVGGGGDDTLYGGSGDDVIAGDSGGNSDVASGNDYLNGEDGKDTLIGGTGDDTLYGGAGDDSMLGDGSGDTSSGNDYLNGGEGNDSLYGGPGDDTLIGGADDDLLSGGTGDDTFVLEGHDTVFGGGGNETVILPVGSPDELTLSMSETYFVFSTDDGAFSLSINPAGSDSITYVFADGSSMSHADLMQAAQSSGLAYDSTGGIASGSSGNDTIGGSEQEDTFRGGAGDDIYAVKLGGGRDQIQDSEGSNVIRFGEGITAADLSLSNFSPYGSAQQSRLSYGDGGDQIYIEDGLRSQVSRIEFYDGSSMSWADLMRTAASLNYAGSDGDDVIFGSDLRDTLYGADGDDSISGQGGDDALYGDGGDDTLVGGVGDDVMLGGDGDDVYVVGSGDDVIQDAVGYNAIQFGSGVGVEDVTVKQTLLVDGTRYLEFGFADGTVKVLNGDLGSIQEFRFDGGVSLGLADMLDHLEALNTIGTGDADSIYGSGNSDAISGGDGDDTIDGRDGNDVISGDAGNDLLYGGGGADTLLGGLGSDTLAGGNGTDTYSLALGMGHDLVVEYAGESSILRIAAGVRSSNVDWRRDGDDLVLFLRSSGEGLVIQDYYTSDQTWSVVLPEGATSGLEDYLASLTAGGAEVETVDQLKMNFKDAVQATVYAHAYAEGAQVGPDGKPQKTEVSGSDVTRWDYAVSFVDQISNDATIFAYATANDIVRTAFSSTSISVPVVTGVTSIEGGFGAHAPKPGGFYPDGNPVIIRLPDGASGYSYSYYWTVPFDYSGSLADAASSASIHQTITQTSSAWLRTSTTDNLVAGDGNNNIYAGTGSIVDAGAGDDTVLAWEAWSASPASPLGSFLYGNTGNDVITGSSLNDMIIGGVDNDTLSGGDGDDTYVFFSGDGTDLVVEGVGGYLLAGGGGDDEIVLPEGADLSSLVITQGPQISLDSRYGRYSSGFMLPTHGEEAYSTVDISWGTTQHIRVVLPHSDNGAQAGIEYLRFANGSTLAFSAALSSFGIAAVQDDHTLVGTRNYAVTGPYSFIWNDPLLGGVGNDTLSGSGWLDGGIGNDLVSGGSGNDTLIGQEGSDTLVGGDGDDLLGGSLADFWTSPDGVVGNVYDGGKGYDTLVGTAFEDTYHFAVGDGRDLILDDTTDFSDTRAAAYIMEEYGYGGPYALSLGVPDDIASDGANKLWQSDYFNYYGTFKPETVSTDNLKARDRLVFGPGIRAEDVRLFKSSAGPDADLLLILPGDEDAIRIRNWFGDSRRHLKQIEFEGGAVWDSAYLDAIRAEDIPQGGWGDLEGSAGNDSIFGLGDGQSIYGYDGDDNIDAGLGGDVIVGGMGDDVLNGGAGDDTYLFAAGDGNDVIVDTGGDDDSLYIEGARPEATVVTRHGFDLLLSLTESADVITLKDWFLDDSHRVETIIMYDVVTGDSVVWDVTEILSRIATSSNTAPVAAAPIPDQSTTEGSSFSYLIPLSAFTDADGDALSYAVKLSNGDDLPSWLSFDETTRTFSGTPPGGAAGTLNIEIKATDTSGASVSDIFALTIASAIPVINIFGDDGINILIGNAGNNIIEAFGGNDTIDGGAGNDSINGSAGDDSIHGGDGDDSIKGGSDNDTIYGDAGNDYIDVDSGNNLAYGGTGNDTVTGDGGNDTLYGNEDNDSVYGGAGNDSLFGGIGNDTVSGGSGNDTVYGADGNDTVLGGSGNDVLWGGLGDDSLDGGSGSDTLDGGVGNDSLYGGGENDTLDGGLGDDRLDGGGENDLVRGGDGNDQLFGGAENDTLEGGVGNDTLSGDSGIDMLYGQAGDDVYLYNDIRDTIVEAVGEGTDRVESSVTYVLGSNIENLVLVGTESINGIGNSLNNIIIGNSAANSLSAESGDDWLDGGEGNDTLDGGAGADTLVGGYGNDIYIVDNIGDVVTELANQGTDTIESSITYSLFATANVENLTLTGSAAINGTGSESANVLTGNAGNNVLNALGGDDTIDGGAGNDTINGSVGNDVIHGGDGNDSIDGGADNDTLYGDTGDDHLEAGSGNDQASGGLGNDTLFGEEGNDTLYGDAGNDSLDGDSGDDSLFGGDGGDNLFGDTGNDTLYGELGNDQLHGGGGDDQVYGGDGNDTLDGSSGQDLLDGGAGDDTLTGGADMDTLMGGAGGDWLDGGGDNDLVQGGEGDDYLIGNSGNDKLEGGVGVDSLYGGSGDDTLDGGSESDSLVGGSGNDTYIVDNAGDVVTELSGQGTDTIFSSVNYMLGANIENLTLTGTHSLVGTGNELANALTGNAEGSSLNGMGGNDTLIGGSGSDTLDGGAGADSMAGGADDDVYYVDDAGDIVVEQAAYYGGWDSVISAVSYTLSANVESLTLTGTAISGTGNALENELHGNAQDNVLTAGAGADILDGGEGADTMIGGADDDFYIIDSMGDVVQEAADEGDDGVYLTLSGDYTLSANVESASRGGSGSFRTTGNAGDNFLGGNGGDDTLVGGLGNDLYSIQNMGDVIIENTDEGTDTVYLNGNLASYTLGANLENLQSNEYRAVSLTGNAGNNVIKSLYNNSTPFNDTLDGGAGADTLVGGYGNDIYIVDNIGDVVTELANQGTDTIQSSITYSLFATANVENLTLTGSAAINGTGSESANVLTGNAGNNVLNALGGDDTIDGGAGNDTINGSVGNDVIHGGDGNDSIDGGADNDTLYGDTGDDHLEAGSGNDQASGGLGNDTLFGEEGNDTLYGDAGNDSLDGDSGDDRLFGGDGGDNLFGDTGNDTLYGELGNDQLHGGGGDDQVYGGDGNDALDGSSGQDLLDGGAGDDTLTGGADMDTLMGGAGGDWLDGGGDNDLVQGGEGDDYLIGNSGNDKLEGGVGVDSLYGGSGDDTLDGGSESDSLVGGSGNDTYILGRGYGTDTVTESGSSGGSADVLKTAMDVAASQLWFAMSGNNLEVSIIGTSDKMVITNWSLGSQYHVEQFKSGDGKTLLDSQVANLVSAMANFDAPPGAGQTTLPTDYQASLNSVIAANWS